MPVWKYGTTLLMILFGFSHSASARNNHPHYTFTFPDKYVGWVQVVFNDPQASPLPQRNHGYVIDVPESGIIRTSFLRVQDDKSRDEFYYRVSAPNGSVELHVLPSDYAMAGDSHGGFGVMDTGGRGRGYSWFIFIGPPELRAKVPLADWNKVIEEWRKSHQGKARIDAPATYPQPGRMQWVTPSAEDPMAGKQ